MIPDTTNTQPTYRHLQNQMVNLISQSMHCGGQWRARRWGSYPSSVLLDFLLLLRLTFSNFVLWALNWHIHTASLHTIHSSPQCMSHSDQIIECTSRKLFRLTKNSMWPSKSLEIFNGLSLEHSDKERKQQELNEFLRSWKVSGWN
jgi:hypothetical protein